MSDHLNCLESAISDVGSWTWWTADLPNTFQVEFNGTQLWNPPTGEGLPPSSQIALRFRKPRLVYFLTFSTTMRTDWPDQLHRDELKPFSVEHDTFSLTSTQLYSELVKKAITVNAFLGQPGESYSPLTGESIIGFAAHQVGLVVAAESMGVISYQGEMDPEAVIASNRKWWEYWREYWQRRETSDALPKDYGCEVTIPAAKN